MVKRLSKLFVGAVGVFLAFGLVAIFNQANAQVLQNAYVTMDDARSGEIGTQHTFQFYHPGTTLGSVRFRYCVEPSGATCSATGVGTPVPVLTDANSSKGGGATSADWTSGSWTGSTDRWVRINADAPEATANNTWRFVITGMNNPIRTNCNFTTNTSVGTCYVRVTTYSDVAHTTQTAEASVSISVTENVQISATVDPIFTVTIAGTAGNGVLAFNGRTLTSGITTTATTIPFGNLTANTAKFAGHFIQVTGNNTGGYTGTVKMSGTAMTGSAYASIINGFAAPSASITNPVAWTSPTGTASGTNTGWLGVGTDDTGVPNPGSNVFYTLAVEGAGTAVAQHNGPSNSRASRVVYGIEVNPYQQADVYSGDMIYTFTATF